MRRSLSSGEDRGFRWSIGALASLLVMVVLGVGLVLAIDSRKSIATFGLAFWKTRTWDPVGGIPKNIWQRNGRVEFSLGPGAHTHYWDSTAEPVAETLDALIARAPTKLP